MKGDFDKIYRNLKERFEADQAKGGLFSLLRPPSKLKIIEGLAGWLPIEAFGKEYFQAMVIVLQAHWYVSFVLDLRIAHFFMPAQETPRRTTLIFELFAHTPMPSKIAFIKKHQLLDNKNIDRLGLINTARNAFAHFYQPGNAKMKYRKLDLISEDGLEKFWKDCEEVIHACREGIKS